MPGFGELVQKAFYLGVGVASYAGEKAGSKLGEFRVQAQKIADEMVARGEMTTDEARRLVNEVVQRAQQQSDSNADETVREPRRIEILDDSEIVPHSQSADVNDLRHQVADLRDELRRLRNQNR